MGNFRRRREQLVTDVSRAVLTALEERLKAAPAQSPADIAAVGAQMLGGMTEFLKGAGDLALRGAASALGQRGGRRTQERKRAAKRLAAESQPPNCELCRDPLTRHVTVEMILQHRSHEGRRHASPETNATGTDDSTSAQQQQPLFKPTLGYRDAIDNPETNTNHTDDK